MRSGVQTVRASGHWPIEKSREGEVLDLKKSLTVRPERTPLSEPLDGSHVGGCGPVEAETSE